MLVLDLHTLLLIPLVLAEAFLLWTLWNLILQSRKKLPASSALKNSYRLSSPSAARVFSFPESSSAAPGLRSSGISTPPAPPQSAQSSRLPHTAGIAGVRL